MFIISIQLLPTSVEQTDIIERWLKKNIPNAFLEHYGRWWLYVSTEEDYLMACFIVDNSGSEYITTKEAINLCLRYA